MIYKLSNWAVSFTWPTAYRRRQRRAEEAIVYVLHIARSWAQLRASPADRPQSEQIWYSQVMEGRPHGLPQFGKGGNLFGNLSYSMDK